MNAQQEVVDGSESGATSQTVTSTVRPKITSTAPSIKPLFGSNTRAIVWGMQTRAVQVNYNSYFVFVHILSTVFLKICFN